MSPKIFITGATGLIGGDFLVIATEKHPEWKISVLIRDPEKSQLVNELFPDVRVVRGSLEDVDMLKAESKAADVVLNFANCDHLPAAEAIIRGLSQRDQTGTVIHTSGAKIIAWEMESQPSTWGTFMPRRYNDLEGVEELTTVPCESNPNPTGYDHILPNWAAHRDVDLAILNGFHKHANVQTAIPLSIPRLLNVVLHLRQAFTINGNENKWNMVHTQDILELYVLLTEAAVEGRKEGLWNEKEFVWGDVIRRIASLGYQKGLLVSDTPVDLSNGVVNQFWRGGQMNMSSTSLGEACRARKLLGWNPTRDGFFGGY
ncbi:NAD(P)-binding protein [Aspergillus sclerotiicarbonarius CBS 121057]|uniref:NAD(P)-binding protein n=1 Tax=Aspergillus sclerotiicarbonarius (strain CBS 121057 / IBT 28362) TaxID=1448318 RepID=A0A319E0R7_ASPSB|nr:NAD(P)-binding protein [Aspergillus sclerotiicarbonarius CBS 121057]